MINIFQIERLHWMLHIICVTVKESSKRWEKEGACISKVTFIQMWLGASLSVRTRIILRAYLSQKDAL